jgi:hypothetical protein
MIMRRHALSGVLFLLAAGAWVLAQDARTLERRPWEDYEVLIERNLFSRQRGRRAVEERVFVAPPPPPAQRFVRLRGVTRRGEEQVAFLEDMRSGDIIRARAGSRVVDGTVMSVGVDTIIYALDGNEVEVAIGENLEASTESAPVAASTGTGSTSTAAPAAPAGSEDILERLRRQRMEELGQ